MGDGPGEDGGKQQLERGSWAFLQMEGLNAWQGAGVVNGSVKQVGLEAGVHLTTAGKGRELSEGTRPSLGPRLTSEVLVTVGVKEIQMLGLRQKRPAPTQCE